MPNNMVEVDATTGEPQHFDPNAAAIKELAAGQRGLTDAQANLSANLANIGQRLEDVLTQKEPPPTPVSNTAIAEGDRTEEPEDTKQAEEFASGMKPPSSLLRVLRGFAVHSSSQRLKENEPRRREGREGNASVQNRRASVSISVHLWRLRPARLPRWKSRSENRRLHLMTFPDELNH